MASVAKRPVLREPAAAKLDLAGDLGGRRLDRISGVVQNHHGPLDDDRSRRLQGDRYRFGFGLGFHGGNLRGAEAQGLILESLELINRSPDRGGDAPGRDQRFGHPIAQIVSAPFRKNPAEREPR